MKIKKRILSFALAGTMALGLMPGMTMTALADGETSYTLTIPSTLTVANSGWNALEGGISAKGTLESGKKLVVTPTSENSWNLVANKGETTESKVGYNLAKETGTYSAAAEAPTWEFTELTADGTSQTAGIIVDDYSNKAAGTYQDVVTFTASVEDAAYVPKTFTSLSDGDILRVGDTLDFNSGRYDFQNDGCSLIASNAPFTVLRANIEGLGDTGREPTVTEDVNGAYYVIKRNNNINKYVYFGGRLAVTDTSDGVKITKNGSNWEINVYVP